MSSGAGVQSVALCLYLTYKGLKPVNSKTGSASAVPVCILPIRD